jgi:hypothetical protein
MPGYSQYRRHRHTKMSRNPRRDRSYRQGPRARSGTSHPQNRTKPAPTISQRTVKLGKFTNTGISSLLGPSRPITNSRLASRANKLGVGRLGTKDLEIALMKMAHDLRRLCPHAPRRNANAKSLTGLNLVRFQQRRIQKGQAAVPKIGGRGVKTMRNPWGIARQSHRDETTRAEIGPR